MRQQRELGGSWGVDFALSDKIAAQTFSVMGCWNSSAKPDLDERSLLGQYRLVKKRMEGSAYVPRQSRCDTSTLRYGVCSASL